MPAPSGSPNVWAQRRAALKQMHVTCVTSEDDKLRDLADPIDQVMRAIDSVQSKPLEEQQQLVLLIDRLMFQVQGQGVLAYLKSLQELRNTIADRAAKAPAGSEQKKKLEMAQAAHEEVIHHLGAAYDALCRGDQAAFEKAQRQLYALQQPLKELYDKTA